MFCTHAWPSFHSARPLEVRCPTIFERKLPTGQLRSRPLAPCARLRPISEKPLPTKRISVSDRNQSLRLQFPQSQLDFLDTLAAAAGEIGESTASVDEKIDVPLEARQR